MCVSFHWTAPRLISRTHISCSIIQVSLALLNCLQREDSYNQWKQFRQYSAFLGSNQLGMITMIKEASKSFGDVYKNLVFLYNP